MNATLVETIMSSELKKRFGDELYGICALLEVGGDPAQWELMLAMIGDQETHHILEGLALAQRESRQFEFDGRFVINPYTGEPMVDTCQHAIDVIGEAEEPDFYHRLINDKAVEEGANDLMRDGHVGDGLWRASPYAHERTPKGALAIGMWPERERSYGYLYRKTSATTLEVTTMTIDSSNMDAYRHLFGANGVPIQPGAQSHELSAIMIPVHGMIDATDRTACLDEIMATYAEGHPDGYVACVPDAQDFLARHQAEVDSIQGLQEALAQSLRTGQLNRVAIAALKDSYALAQSLNLSEQYDLIDLARSSGQSRVTLQEHERALRFLINVRRYGIWHYLRQELDGGEQQKGSPPSSFAGYARLAAWAHEVMPGCPGGFGLEAMFATIWRESDWHGGVIRSGICEGCNRSTKVGVAGWCHSCISDHCGG